MKKNISDLNDANIQLRREKEFIEISLDSQIDTFFVFDPLTGKALRWNKSFREISGYTDEEISTQKAPESYYSEEDVKKAHEYIEKLLSGCPDTVVLDLITKDGTRIPTEYSASTIESKGEESTYIISIGRDIRDHKKNEIEKANLEIELRQAHKMEAIGTLAGGIAHDFNNVLAAIMGYTEIAMTELPEGTPAAEDLQEVLKASTRAKELVKQILAFSRKTEQERKPIEPYLIVKEALKLLRASTPTTIDLQQDIDPKSGTIMADPTQLHQVVVNLCTNAAQAMEEKGGVMKIGLNAVNLGINDVNDLMPGPYIKLCVSDTGHGIDEALLGQIFDPYFTTKEFGRGSGMGLSVVHGIVKSYGGTVTVDSKVGGGSTFNIYFPQIEVELTPEVEEDKILPIGTERIIVVDDESAIVGMYKRTLEQLGYKVSSYTNSLEAFDAFKSRPGDFDLIVTDQTMPLLPGSELAKELIKARPDIPIILCTGYSSTVSEKKAEEIGIREFAMKPVGREKLARLVRKVLDE